MEDEIIKVIKNIAKKLGKSIRRILLPILIPIIIIVILLSACVYFITIDDGSYKEDDWSSVPYGAAQYNSAVTVNKEGTIKAGRTAQEIWDEMEENNSRVDEYLDKPKELAKLMNAQIVTQYPDTRSNPDEEINWDDVDLEQNELQGIIKFKRADKDGNISTLSYVDETTFNDWVKNGNAQALKHFTLKKSRASGSIKYNGPDLCWPVEPHFTNITSYFGYRGDIGVAGATSDHGGIDIAQAGIDGTNTYACEAGNIIQATNSGDYNGGMGNSVTIDHGNGYVSVYMHMQTGSVTVQVGDTVTKGQVIGAVGTTGASSGPHCHFQIEYNGEKIDPLSFKYNNGMGEGAGGFGTSSTSDEVSESDRNSETSTDDEESNNDRNQSRTTGQGEAITVDGDGYIEEYTSSAGITYKDYKQFMGSYAYNSYWGGTISSDGCGPTSLAILASGLTNLNYTPADIASEMDSTYGYTGPIPLKEQMESMGMTAEIVSNPSGEDIINNLKNGQVMMVGVNPGTFTSVGHWMAIVDVNTAGEVYICNPGSSSLYGWYDADFIAGETATIIVTDAGASGVASRSNTSSYTAVVATWRQVDTKVTSNDPNVEESNDTVYTMTTTQINYQELVDKYTMPFDLLWALLVVGESKEFVMELADLAYNSEIEITVHDNYRKNTDVDKWTYTRQDKITGGGYLYDTYHSNRATVEDFEELEEHNYTTTKTVITQTNTLDIGLTKADTWIVEYSREYTHKNNPTTTNSSTDTKDDTEWEDAQEQPNQNTYNHPNIEEAEKELKEKADEEEKVRITRYLNLKKQSRYINIKDNITNTVESSSYQASTPTIKEKTDLQKNVDPADVKPNFVTIYMKTKYSTNRANIGSAASWLFEILETNDSTKDMVDLIKYLLYKATNKDYGVTEFDFDELFTMHTSTSMGQISGDTVAEQVWNYFRSAGFSEESTAGIMGNFYQESGMDPTNDGGAAAGICMFEKSTGCFSDYQAYANSRGKEWTDLQSQLDYLMTQLPSTFDTYTGLPRHYYDTGEWCWWPISMTLDEFKAILDIDEATEIFERVYERASLPMMERRKSAAQDYYNIYNGR